ncbi:MAG: N-acetylmuramoyl-L-alanine amidase [Ginsengibacter sp.]
MLILAYYILKVTICSGILYGYYLVALRDKIFHKWNRFYLLAALIISLAAPLIKINIWQNGDENKTQIVQLLQVVNTGDEFVYEYTRDNGNFHINVSNLSLFIYIVVSGLLFAFLVRTFLRINRLKKNCQQTIVEGINFINTDAKGTPFSFFNNIFWNENIDISSSTGKQIFKHEVAHVQEKHSYDKIFINVLLIFFWINPFFWLMRKEINMIHEFIADKKALEDSDTDAFAAMILQATYPNQQFNLANNFFYSPIKRRLLMLTKNKNPKMSYLSRMLVLPLTALVFFAFTLKMKTINSTNTYTGKKITVVIDAGHGGEDRGISVNNIAEKDVALAIAKAIKELNKNDNINIILSREDDKTISVKDRVIFSKANNADLFISIHIDGEENKNTHSGMSLFIPGNNNVYLNQSKLLGSDILESFKSNYQLPVPAEYKQRDKGIYVLNANPSPSILIEVGFLTTKKDFDYLVKQKNQEIIAQNILNGIEKYAVQNLLNKATMKVSEVKDTTHVSQPHTFARLEGKAVLYDKINKVTGEADTIIIQSFNKSENANFTGEAKHAIIINQSDTSKEPIYFLDEKEISKNEMKQISPNKIQSINVLKGESAIKKYGDKGKYGVIEILKKSDTFHPVTEPVAIKSNKIFTKVEVDPSFPGGNMAWSRYIKKIIEGNIDELSMENKSGTCRVKFVVDISGIVSDVQVLSMQGTKLAQVSMDAIKKGPKWIPAMQNDHVVAAYKEQPITFTIQDN